MSKTKLRPFHTERHDPDIATIVLVIGGGIALAAIFAGVGFELILGMFR